MTSPRSAQTRRSRLSRRRRSGITIISRSCMTCSCASALRSSLTSGACAPRRTAPRRRWSRARVRASRSRLLQRLTLPATRSGRRADVTGACRSLTLLQSTQETRAITLRGKRSAATMTLRCARSLIPPSRRRGTTSKTSSARCCLSASSRKAGRLTPRSRPISWKRRRGAMTFPHSACATAALSRGAQMQTPIRSFRCSMTARMTPRAWPSG